MKTILYLAAIILAPVFGYYAYEAFTEPRYDSLVIEPIDPSVEPDQREIADPEPIPIVYRKGRADLIPLASYRIAAKVCGRQRYWGEENTAFAPYDLCLAWGDVATKDLKESVKFDQDMRWYNFRVRFDSPLDAGYVGKHSANVHLLYAQPKLRRMVSRLKKNDIVELTGYLVFMKGAFDGRPVEWKSSLRRDDSGRGACELMYVTSLRIGERLYGDPVER
jgi:hypothetical protein